MNQLYDNAGDVASSEHQLLQYTAKSKNTLKRERSHRDEVLDIPLGLLLYIKQPTIHYYP